MSKTERVLTGEDDAALDELDEFVASEAEAADNAIGELIDDVVEDRTNGDGAADHSVPDGYGSAVPEAEPAVDPGDETPVAGNGFDTGEVEVPEAERAGNGLYTGESERPAADAEADVGGNGSGGVVVVHVEDDEVPVVESTDPMDAEAEDTPIAAPLEDDKEPIEETYELPEIIPATTDGPEEPDAEESSGEIVAREGDLDEPVSDDIIEELRRADIDGPMVEFAPQDDTTTARRRPKRRPDYDPAPVPIPAKPPRVLGRKPRVRKVTRVVRSVDPWSVFKIAAIANLVLYVILLVAGVLLWNVAYATGTIDNIERFFESFGWSSFEFNGGEIYHAAWIAGLFAAIGLTGLAVLAATMFNLITDIVGGMRFTVLEEEVVETRTSPMRRFVVRRPEPVVPAETEDSTGSLVREAVVDDSNAIEKRTR